MSFGEVWTAMYANGLRVRRRGWEGYWEWRHGTIMIHCRDGSVLDIRHTDDPAFTFSNIAAEDWEIVKN